MSFAGAHQRLPSPISILDDDKSPTASAIAGGELDDLKFRIVRRGKCHYFSDVRFRDDEEGKNLISFLEGNALEQLSPQMLRGVFGTAAIVIPLQNLVRDLQRVFC